MDKKEIIMVADARIIRKFNGQYRGTEVIARNLQIKEELLWWQKKGLQYTNSGYGKKIPTSYKVLFNNRWYRIYNHIFSNSGTLYFISKKKDILIDIY